MSVAKLKNKIRNISEKKKIPHEVLYQNFFFERFLERLSLSTYKNKLILKGGFLISSLLGISERTTSDIDMSVENLQLNEEIMINCVESIITIDIDDGTSFKIINIVDIRLEDKYDGLRFTLEGKFETLKYHIKLDFSTGDVIVPMQEKRYIDLFLSEKKVELYCYSIETFLSEKIETILSRNIGNTRAKDFYDVYSIITKDIILINTKVLIEAIKETINNRGSDYIFEDYMRLYEIINSSDELKLNWELYTTNYIFAKGLSYKDIMDKLLYILIVCFE